MLMGNLCYVMGNLCRPGFRSLAFWEFSMLNYNLKTNSCQLHLLMLVIYVDIDQDIQAYLYTESTVLHEMKEKKIQTEPMSVGQKFNSV